MAWTGSSDSISFKWHLCLFLAFTLEMYETCKSPKEYCRILQDTELTNRKEKHKSPPIFFHPLRDFLMTNVFAF
jgi:hypothetical protein